MPVVLLCHFDGTNGSTVFTDSSPSAHTLTPINATVNTAASKFGTGEGDFTAGFNARIDTANSVDFNFGAGQFTVETWAYFTASSGLFAMLSQWDSASNNSWWFGMNSGVLTFFYSTTGSNNFSLTVPFSPTLNTWYHIAVDRDVSNTLRLYVNGVVQNSATVSATFFAATVNCQIGNDSHFDRGFTGHLDEARITKGLAQYGGAFTPATAPFGNTVDLAGNLGGSSHYGKFSYGKAHYSRISAFTPIFAADVTVTPAIGLSGGVAPIIVLAADLDVHVNLIELGGGIAPQIALGGALAGDWVLAGDMAPNVVLAAQLASGPLWTASVLCPPPVWGESETCPPSIWTPTIPPDWAVPGVTDPAGYGMRAYGEGAYTEFVTPWEPAELCNGG